MDRCRTVLRSRLNHRRGQEMKARIKWIEDVAFMGETGSGHTVVLDGPPESGGRNVGLRPMEAILIGIGGCTAFDVVSILGKARQRVTDCIVEVDAERAEKPPRVFTHICLRFRVVGKDLKEAQVQRAVKLSSEKYCSATLMLRNAVAITHEYEIVESDA